MDMKLTMPHKANYNQTVIYRRNGKEDCHGNLLEERIKYVLGDVCKIRQTLEEVSW